MSYQERSLKTAVKRFINTFADNETITGEDFSRIKYSPTPWSTVDLYMQEFQRTGNIKRLGRGQYVKLKNISIE